MTTYLLDTNVVSELRKRVQDQGLLDWLAGTRTSEHFLSVLTVGELHRGIEQLHSRGDDAQAALITSFVTRTQQQFAKRIVPITADVAREWGRQPGIWNVGSIDGLIAATAVVHGMTVVTRNTKDFEHTGAAVLNPFAG